VSTGQLTAGHARPPYRADTGGRHRIAAEIAVALRSIPPAWFTDDVMLATLLDVMDANAERIKRKRRR
jgi:hypothetical protein